MNRKKRLMMTLLVGILILFTKAPIESNAEEELEQTAIGNFSDVDSDAWYESYIRKLVESGGVNGYEDGTFKPNATITYAEFLTMLTKSIGVQPTGMTGKHWATGIFDGARKASIIFEGEYPETMWNTPITRYDMARLSSRALAYKSETIPSYYTDAAALLSDSNTLLYAYKEDVLKVVAMGVINGYSDGSFQGDRTLTRAEGSVVIINIIEAHNRKVPDLNPIIKLGETKSFRDVLTMTDEKYAKQRDFGYIYDTVTLVPSSDYKFVKRTTTTGQTMIDLYDERCVIWFVMGDSIFSGTSGEWDRSKERTAYDDYYLFYSAEYFAFAKEDEKNLKMIRNPFKENTTAIQEVDDRDALPEGHGAIALASGVVYEGELINGEPTTEGTYTFQGGATYQGEWGDDGPDGYGTMTYADGSVYEGEWADGERNGYGTIIYGISSGKYVGEWKDDQRHGKGTSYYLHEGDDYNDCAKYEGEYKHNKKDGLGKYTYKNGKVKKGLWEDGEFVEGSFINP